MFFFWKYATNFVFHINHFLYIIFVKDWKVKYSKFYGFWTRSISLTLFRVRWWTYVFFSFSSAFLHFLLSYRILACLQKYLQMWAVLIWYEGIIFLSVHISVAYKVYFVLNLPSFVSITYHYTIERITVRLYLFNLH